MPLTSTQTADTVMPSRWLANFACSWSGVWSHCPAVKAARNCSDHLAGAVTTATPGKKLRQLSINV